MLRNTLIYKILLTHTLTKLLMTLTISVVASILVIGALIASPDAYSDKKDDGVLDECKCEKPHTLKVLFTVPDTELPVPDNVSFKAEIFKKLDDKNNEEKLLDFFPVTPNEVSMVQASQWGKDKLESNTAFVIYKVTDSDNNTNEEVVAEMEIHTSCSKPLFIGQTVSDNGYSLEVKDGLAGTDPPMTSIPIDNPLTCEDEKKKSTGSITVKKAITNDNDGTAVAADFEITITNVETNEKIILVHDEDESTNPLINVNNVPAGTYTLSETAGPSGYTTVLIAGDTYCPSMLEEVFTIKKNKHLSCIIYNDDDKGTGGGTGGIIFQNNSLQILIDALLEAEDIDNDGARDVVDNTIDSCVTGFTFDTDLNEEVPVRKSAPCIEIIDNFSIAIVDPALGVNTRTIVLFSVIEDEINNDMIGAIDPQCVIERLIPYSAFTSNTADTNLTVVLSCANINSVEVLNVNYVMIDPTIVT